MKKAIFKFTFIILSALPGSLIAQTYKIDTSHIEFKDKFRPCLITEIDPEPDVVKEAWHNYLKDKYDIKLSGIGLFSNRDLLEAEEVLFKAISPKRLSFYTKITETKSGSEMATFAALGYDIFIGPDNYPQEFASIERIMDQFLYQYLDNYYDEEIKATSKKIKSLDNDKKDRLKEIEKNNKEIIEISQKIASLNSTAKPNSDDAIEATEELNEQSEDKLELQKENNELTEEVKEIDEKLWLRKKKLERLKARNKGLVN